ncbi:MAG TPA: DUF2089 family protein [Chloroflexota bacterium]|nr:DUF2089 family protein [Chloroflexota bacterium]
MCFNVVMEEQQTGIAPSHCPVCQGELLVTRLQCGECGTEVTGAFSLTRLATLREPHASLLEMFLRVRGNVKEMERELGLSYPTVRARLEEALTAAGFPREDGRPAGTDDPGWEARFEADLAQRIRARVEEQLASLNISSQRVERESDLERQRAEVLDRLERGDLPADEAAALLRKLRPRR